MRLQHGAGWPVVWVFCLFVSVAGMATAAQSDAPLARGLAAYNAGDYKAAYNLALPLADKGDPAAKNLLGMMYELGKGVPQDLAKSVAFYRQGAEQGDPYAQYNLAVSYDAGSGVPQNYREAVRWFLRAAKQGVSAAQYDLAVMMEEGRGIQKNYQQAAKWYQQAARQGHVQAQNNLAWLYENGQGVERDLVQAYAWFDVAAAQGFAAAATRREVLKAALSAKELRQAQAQAVRLKKHSLASRN